MFVVSPKYDCPHEASVDISSVLDFLATKSAKIMHEPCPMCYNSNKKEDSQLLNSNSEENGVAEIGNVIPSSEFENWLCLECKGIFCSRYVNSHMCFHYDEMKGSRKNHCIGMSFSDGSFWCYECDSYIYSSELKKISLCFGVLKHPPNNCVLPTIDENDEDINNDFIEKVEIQNENVTFGDDKFSIQQLVDGLISKQFKKVCFLTGAGISVAAGIPDFRTPGVGLYAKIRELNIPSLPEPELLFNIEIFKARPELFYTLSLDMLRTTAKPVKAHYFVKHCADEQMLLMNYTQNIDSLELDAGLDPNLLVQAHGHMRLAHCIECGQEYSMKLVVEVAEREEIPYCDKCAIAGLTSLVKPDVVFFGEQLPTSFYSHFEDIRQADLVIVMGTSLKVFPFAMLLMEVPEHVPIVLINRENTGGLDHRGDRFLFLQGDIETIVADIMAKVGWSDE